MTNLPLIMVGEFDIKNALKKIMHLGAFTLQGCPLVRQK